MGRNPVVGVQRPRVERKEMTAWTVAEARTFLDAVEDDRLSWLWHLALLRGLRRGELCGLRWSDVDLEAGVIRIRATRLLVDGKALMSTPKTSAGRRTIPLDAALVSILRGLRAQQAREKLAAGAAYVGEDFLLADELGRPYRPSHVNARFDKLVKTTGLPRLRVHDLRHSSASLMLANGTPTKVAAELLGHSSPTITLSIYAHVLPGMAEEAGEQLSKLVLG